MPTLAAISLVLLLFAAVEQLLATTVFVIYCRRQSRTSASHEPPVLVLLPVRGADHTLADCVMGLARQDYASYRVCVIFDSPADPGWAIVEQVQKSLGDAPIELVLLGTPRRHCSLKCSAVFEATEDLADAEVVAIVDSDVVPHENWLRELVAPLANERVGVSHGNRWYLPPSDGWASLFRYCWNAVAVVTMHLWNMPWGGSMAIKRRVLVDSDIRQRWLRAGCEDVPLVSVLRGMRLESRFVPELIMKDRRDTTMRRCLPFLQRQMLWARLYHPACWWASNLWQIAIALSIVISAGAAVWGATTSQLDLVLMGAVALVVFNVTAVLLLSWIERTLLPRERGPASRRLLKCSQAILFSNLMMVAVILTSLFARVIRWRGITYRVQGPWQIEMVEYHPFGSESVALSKIDQLSSSSPT